jgi:hypothetical protein
LETVHDDLQGWNLFGVTLAGILKLPAKGSNCFPQKVEPLIDAERSHSHRGFSPVVTRQSRTVQPFHGFALKSLKRLRKVEALIVTGLKPRCE